MWPWARRAVCRCSKRRLLPTRRCSVAATDVVGKLEKRGLIEQTTRVGASPPPEGCGVYVGFDPTADSLHIGHLLSIITLLHFQRHGYQPIAVVGGATGVVGDPSGRTKEREGISSDSLERNKAALKENLQRIFLNGQAPTARQHLKVYDNGEWWGDVSALEFVSGISRHFRLSAMLAKESVRQRLESDEGMSCAEFLYPVFQSYDFLQLHKKANCWIQVGGGDQWGNISAGVDFVKRATGHIVHGVTLPLLTTSSGDKLGKSAGNAVWLSPDKTSPYHLYQHFMQTSDQDVGRLLRCFSFMEGEELDDVMHRHEGCPEKFGAQRCLADTVTRLVHGEEGVEKAKSATAVLFGDKSALSGLTGAELDQLFMDAPSFEVSIDSESGKRLVDVVHEAGVFSSLGETESMVRKGGLYVNFERVESTDELFDKEKHVLTGGTTIIRIGKKQHQLIKWKQ